MRVWISTSFPHPQEMPSDPVTLIHHKPLEVSENQAVDRVLHVCLFLVRGHPGLGFVKNHEQGHEFLVDIVGSSVQFRMVRGSDNDRAKQSIVNILLGRITCE